MAELTYTNKRPEHREAFSVSFEIPDDLTVNEFKIMCIRLAHSIGYSDSSIERVFGKESEVIGSDTKTDELLKALGIETQNELTGSVNG